ncbi:MAG: histidine kinase [Acidiferrobacterales bacterium]|nr:histidine kinase [Acidiferrobacterales bacterium]
MKLPSICKNSSLLMFILYAELFAIFLVLIKVESWNVTSLGYHSMYILWMVLGTLLVICSLTKKFPACHGLAVICIASAVIFVALESFVFLLSNQISVIQTSWRDFIERLILLSFVVFFLSRLLALVGVSEQRNKAEVNSRIQALQARIQPHFLFNCLNTISELINSQPKQAEQAVDGLAMLFRAGIESDTKFHTLESELSLCRRYVDLERWRLAERLSIDWQIEVAEQTRWLVPKLILQPLIENGIMHGAKPDGNIEMIVDVKESKGYISCMVQNSKSSYSIDSEHKKGHGIAVDNIRERLFVLYDDKQRFRVSDGPDSYKVIMRIPKQSKLLIGH